MEIDDIIGAQLPNLWDGGGLGGLQCPGCCVAALLHGMDGLMSYCVWGGSLWAGC